MLRQLFLKAETLFVHQHETVAGMIPKSLPTLFSLTSTPQSCSVVSLLSRYFLRYGYKNL